MLAAFSLALSHPARIVIVELLQENGYCLFHDLRRSIPLSDATISQHLQMLRRVHFIRHQELPNGQIVYTLDPEGFAAGCRALQAFTQAA